MRLVAVDTLSAAGVWVVFFFSSRRRHTRCSRDWSSDVCSSDLVQSRSQQEIVATLGIRRGALHGEFTTRNTLEPERSIRMQLVSGPFRTLQGEWRLLPIQGYRCPEELTLRFPFRHPPTPLLLDSPVAAIICSPLDAFLSRPPARAGGPPA